MINRSEADWFHVDVMDGVFVPNISFGFPVLKALKKLTSKTIDVHFQICFDYKNMNKVMRIIKEKNLEIISQQMKESCQIIIATRKKNAKIIFDIFFNLFETPYFAGFFLVAASASSSSA